MPDFYRSAQEGENKTYKELSTTCSCVLKKVLTKIQSTIFIVNTPSASLVFIPSVLSKHSHSPLLFIMLHKIS